MLYANAQDSNKIIAKLNEILGAALAAGKEQVFVNARDFYRSCKLEKLQRSRFTEEVGDTLTLTEVCNKFGTWIYAEYGDGLHVFCKLAKPRYVFSLEKDAIVDLKEEPSALVLGGQIA